VRGGMRSTQHPGQKMTSVVACGCDDVSTGAIVKSDGGSGGSGCPDRHQEQ